MKFFRSFLLSSSFLGLMFLAFNPHIVVRFQNKFDADTKTLPTENSAPIEQAEENQTVKPQSEITLPAEPLPVKPSSNSEAEKEITPEKISKVKISKVKISDVREEAAEPQIIKAVYEPVTKRAALPETLTPDLENLPRLDIIDNFSKQTDWIGQTPCPVTIFDAPLVLNTLGPSENGPLLDAPIEANDGQVIKDQPTYIFKSKNGMRLKLVKPAIDYYDVSGRDFRAAQNDIFDRKPLETLRGKNTDLTTSNDEPNRRVTSAADIYSPTTLSYTISGRLNRFNLVLNKTLMTTAYLVTLPRWKDYHIAPAAEKEKWDKFFCNVAHHELGHLRIRLDILAETLDGYAALPPAQSFEEMESLVIAYRTDINTRIQDRQDAYHIYNTGGMRRGMTELPYAQLPFPWLERETSSP